MSLTSVETSQANGQTKASLYAIVHAFLAECVVKADQPEFFGAHGDKACRYIVDDGNEERIAATLQDWANGIVEGRCYELPLNGAGLKLNSTVRRRGDGLTLWMYVGGDQAGCYPQFVAWANEQLFKLGLCRSWHRPNAS